MVRRIAVMLIAGLAVTSAASSQMRGMGACCSGSTAELKGKVARVQITPGEGMPFVMVRTGDRTVKVYLGSMRYLMTNGFSPKVDDDILVKAYPAGGDFVAATVTLPASGKTIRLRDEKGFPLWRGGAQGGGPPK